MATAHWRAGYSVAQLYHKAGVDWSFVQLVRLLLPTDVADDHILDEINRRLKFTAPQSMDFPPGQIRAINVPSATAHGDEVDEGDSRTGICSSHYNIAGLGGPLAEPFVDMLRDDLAAGPGAMAAFIDLFNQRIQSLRYLIQAHTDNGLTSALAAKTHSGRFLLSLSGHLSEAQRTLHQQSADTLIGLAGTLANVRMSLPAIRRLVRVTLDLPLLEMKSLQGRWLTVEACDHTLLGSANHRLGGEATLGRKIWDQQAIFELVIGPMAAERLQSLVPDGEDHGTLRHLAQWVSESRCDCRITLVCEEDGAGVAQLSSGKNISNSLGFGSWLSGQKSEHKRVSFMLNLVN